MTDHIVVFDGHPRLIGRTLPVSIDEASALTLFGTAVTGEQVGVAAELSSSGYMDQCNATEAPAPGKRISLPLA
jgi:hypothetical protein